MSNVCVEIGYDIKVAAIDTEHAVVAAVQFLPKAAAVIASAITDQPEVKSAVLGLVQRAETVVGDVTGAAVDKGINLAEDAKALADAEVFFTWFKSSFVPVIEQVYAEVKTDIQ